MSSSSGRKHCLHLTTSLLIYRGTPGKREASVLDKDRPATEPTKVTKHPNAIAVVDLTVPAQETGVISLFFPAQPATHHQQIRTGKIVEPMEKSMNDGRDPEHALVINSDSEQEV